MSKPRKDDYDSLKKTWYAKLKDEGFEDIEQDEDTIKWYSESRVKQSYRNQGLHGIQSLQEYFRLAGHFAHDYKFETPLDQIIWDYHAEGVSVRETQRLLKSRGYHMAVMTVHNAIRRLREVMFRLNKLKPSESSETDGNE